MYMGNWTVKGSVTDMSWATISIQICGIFTHFILCTAKPVHMIAYKCKLATQFEVSLNFIA